MTTLVLVHVGASLQSTYEQALGVPARVVQVSAGGLSGSYDEKTGLAAQYPTLRAFLNAKAPGWDPASPVVLVAFSAGVWAARAWLRDADARSLTGALVILDGAHGASLQTAAASSTRSVGSLSTGACAPISRTAT